MKKYRLMNNLLGWAVFAVAAVVYLLTIEPTASLWDCGEFIASAYKLEVGHPPGNPIFMLTANLFTQLTSDTAHKAAMVNSMSAIFSALTILFLFWTITRLVRRLLVGAKETMTTAKGITILACGAVGALAYTFSDTFWFSAVEGEVYAFSSLMTALVFWLILKWEEVADEPHADRWLILIAYLMGVSIAVHLLNLLCIPAIVLVWYFRKNPEAKLKGAFAALIVSFVIVGILLFGIIQGVVKVAGWLELLCVNGLSMPYNSGVVLYVILVAAVLSWGIYETMREKYSPTRVKIAFTLSIALLGIPFLGNSPWLGIFILIALTAWLFTRKSLNPATLNTILVGLLVITIGYSSYALIMIRSAANTPMDQNSPEDIFTLRTYLSREQYGETPLLYGKTYVSEPKLEAKGNALQYATRDDGPVLMRVAKKDPSEKDRYFTAYRKIRNVYVDELNMLFPRMYSSSDPRHIQAYKSWANVKGKRVSINDPASGQRKIVIKPTFIENIRFFMNYQINFMYIRYFMWNFSGRQNDIQGHGEVSHGNWITGIPFIDSHLVGPQEDMPDFIAKNKGHNVYYMLPLLLGLLGIVFQLSKSRRGVESFWITFLLFFMTGIAIVIYLNQTPLQPRERDYAYAGSFYAFCIWIGIGTAYIIGLLRRYAKAPALHAAIGGGLICLFVPIQMASQNWDDHDRSDRYMTRDFGYNYLATCEPNAIIYTMGDNDTFPLWYGQEVEGYRTDVRVCNLSYLQTDWYIDQMKRQAYESEPLPISWKQYEYIQGNHDAGYIVPVTDEAWDVGRALARVKSDDPRTKKLGQNFADRDNIPTNTLFLPVDKEAALSSGSVRPEKADFIVDTMFINFGEMNRYGKTIYPQKNYLGKQEMMVLDMLSNNRDWKRPIYFAITVGPEEYVRLNPYFRKDGMAYRVLPIVADSANYLDTDVLYDNLMHKYRWGNFEQPGLYIDENVGRLAANFRDLFGQLGERLVSEGKYEKAIEAMDYGLKSIPSYNLPYSYVSTWNIVKAYFDAGAPEKACAIADELTASTLRELDWYSRMSATHFAASVNEFANDMFVLQELRKFYMEANPDKLSEIEPLFAKYYNMMMDIDRANRQAPGGKNG
jgi:hypothetical protein